MKVIIYWILWKFSLIIDLIITRKIYDLYHVNTFINLSDVIDEGLSYSL